MTLSSHALGRTLRLFALATTLFAVASVLLPTDAFATGTVGSVIKSSATQYRGVTKLMGYISIILGVIVTVVGLWKGKNHFTTPNQPLAPVFYHLAGGAMLVSLPKAAQMFVDTMSLNPTGQIVTKAAATVAPVGGAIALDQMMINFVANVKAPIGYTIWTLSAALGIFFLVSAFLRVSRNSGQDGARGSLGAGTIGRVVVGAILVSYAATADIFSTSLFGSSGIMRFTSMVIPGISNGAAITRASQAVSAVLVFIQIIGFIAFMRGWLMVRAQADGSSNVSTAAAATHIIGGAVAFNISSFLYVVQNTFCGANAGCAVFGFAP